MAEALQGAAVKYLLGISEVLAQVGETPSGKPYIYRDENLANLEDGHYQATSSIVVEDAGPIASLTMSRYRGRRLRVTIWANGDRGITGNLVGPKSVHDKITDTFNVVDRYLHRTTPEPIVWGSYVTISCDRLIDLSEPVLVSEGDGIMIASAYYGVFF